jgi:hypothetical protein
MSFDKFAQIFGGVLVAGAVAVASGAVPLPPQYAWVPAAVGIALRSFTNSNAAQVTTGK